MRPALLVSLLVSLAGCASLDEAKQRREQEEQQRIANENQEAARRRQALERNLARWVGHAGSELVAKWTPTQSTSLPDRSMVIEYDFVGGELLGSSEESKLRLQRAEDAGGDWCKERFVVAVDGRIARYTWQANGSGCPIE